ncbi:MAG: S-formylglutathione hydrolase [Alphaproteobacteria bacterium]
MTALPQPERISQTLCFGGRVETWQHHSAETKTPMRFAVFVPPQAEHAPVPVLYWLSGLTCTEDNFTQKAGAQRMAAELGLMLVAPDTSPRGLDLPGEHDSFDFGSGAGFYVDATRAPWSSHYRMQSYVAGELPALIETHFPADHQRRAIAGHSMGGHGALVTALRHPGRYRSVSAFAPIANPVACPWGEKAFNGYLGEDREAWRAWDATELVRQAPQPDVEILIDQGGDDPFLDEQLRPTRFAEAARQAGQPCTLRMQDGYDHSYFFIATFIADHLAFHARHLAA